jgi:hypothetical protein
MDNLAQISRRGIGPSNRGRRLLNGQWGVPCQLGVAAQRVEHGGRHGPTQQLIGAGVGWCSDA